MTRRLVEAYVLSRGERLQRGTLERRDVELPAVGPGEVLVAPVVGSWEANMDHAIARDPVDICAMRGEDEVVLGNGGVVRVLETGPGVSLVEEGDLAAVLGNDSWDEEGYMIGALAYDAKGSMGVLAKRTVLKEQCVVSVPADTKYTAEQWAAFSLRSFTAWSNWRMAHGAWQLQVEDPATVPLYVFAWGGGSSFAELSLAKHFGAECFMMASSDDRLAQIEAAGIHPIDRRAFGDLSYDPRRHAEDGEFRAAYDRAETTFLRTVRDLTGGRGASIFADFIGAPVYRPTLKALGRRGVLTTAGWKAGARIGYNRAQACTSRTTFVHTHGCSYKEGQDAVRFAEDHGWIPSPPFEVRSWDEVPALAEDYAAGRCGYFPLFTIEE